jgi:hypothetical protein
LKKQSQNYGSQFQVPGSAVTARNVDLKKQSQFMPGLMGVTPFMRGDYDNIPHCEVQENKANKACSERSRMDQLGRSEFGVPSSAVR